VSLRNIGIIYRKELTDSLRDRRTLISSIVVPILNVSLVSKEILTGNFPWGMMALVFGSSCAYAALALSAAANMFQREDVLFRT